jgi:hypothetical protein
MNEAIIILMNMRGGCATIGDTVHALFRVNSRSRRAEPDESNDDRECGAIRQTVSERA